MSFAHALRLVAAVLTLALPAQAQDFKPHLGNPAFTGLWYSAEAGAWIRVWDDALIYQCRASATGVLTSTGVMIGWIVLWERNWSSQAASIDANEHLLLQGGPEALELVRAVRMNTSCEERSPRYEAEAP
jgi:hypothetical protein